MKYYIINRTNNIVQYILYRYIDWRVRLLPGSKLKVRFELLSPYSGIVALPYKLSIDEIVSSNYKNNRIIYMTMIIFSTIFDQYCLTDILTFFNLSSGKAAVPKTDISLNCLLISGSLYVDQGYFTVSFHIFLRNLPKSEFKANY